MFDRVCRENGIRHLLTAPRSPTTTGKVERFHKTLKKDFLAGKTFETIEEAQTAIDGWVVEYNTERLHQGIGMVPPIRRFELAVTEPFQMVSRDDEPPEPVPEMTVGEHRVTRRVGKGGRISLATFPYHVGRWLAGETVDVVVTRDGLVEISHRGVLVATHAVRHPPEAEPEAWRRQPRARPLKPPTVGHPVIRKVDSSGNISFAAATYRVGNAHCRQQVEVRVVGDTVEISQDGKLPESMRSNTIRSELTGRSPTPEANPTGSTPPAKPADECRVGTGARLSSGYRDLTVLTDGRCQGVPHPLRMIRLCRSVPLHYAGESSIPPRAQRNTS